MASWKAVWQYTSKAINMCKPFGAAIQLLDIYSIEIIMAIHLYLFPEC
jgi:hypothetical protein